MKKKILFVSVLFTALSLSLSGCNKNKSKKEENKQQSVGVNKDKDVENIDDNNGFKNENDTESKNKKSNDIDENDDFDSKVKVEEETKKNDTAKPYSTPKATSKKRSKSAPKQTTDNAKTEEIKKILAEMGSKSPVVKNNKNVVEKQEAAKQQKSKDEASKKQVMSELGKNLQILNADTLKQGKGNVNEPAAPAVPVNGQPVVSNNANNQQPASSPAPVVQSNGQNANANGQNANANVNTQPVVSSKPQANIQAPSAVKTN